MGVPVDYDLSEPLPSSLASEFDIGYLNTIVLREAIVFHKPNNVVLVADAGVKVGVLLGWVDQLEDHMVMMLI